MNILKMLTYNVQTGKRIDRIVDWLNRLPDTDIICLQEFPKDKIDECMLLLSRIPYGYAYAEAFTYRKKIYGELTLFRKDRIKKVRSKIITLWINRTERRILKTTIPRSFLTISGYVGSSKIVIVNVHVVALAVNSVKYAQVKHLIDHVRHLRCPLVLLGDFNISSLLGKRNLFSSLKREGYTMDPKKILTHRVGPIKHQFDYVFCRNCEVIDQHVEKIKFSDHYPLIAQCQI